MGFFVGEEEGMLVGADVGRPVRARVGARVGIRVGARDVELGKGGLEPSLSDIVMFGMTIVHKHSTPSPFPVQLLAKKS